MNYIVSCFFTTHIDPQSNKYWTPNTNIMSDWYKSGTHIIDSGANFKMVVLYDELPQTFIQNFNNMYIEFIKVTSYIHISPYEYRWRAYSLFLEQINKLEDSIFFTDISDVVIASDPFISINQNNIYLGDEQLNKFNNSWSIPRLVYYHQEPSDFIEIYNIFQFETFLNAGIIGGVFQQVKLFIDYMNHYLDILPKVPDSVTDMILFNYVARKYFSNIVHGIPVNSVFSQYETSRTDVYFIHK